MAKNVLVFPCGSEIGLEVHKSLAHSRHFRLFGGSSTDDHGKFVYSNYIGNIPFVTSPNFISAINDILTKYEIEFIIPAHDDAVLQFSLNQHLLQATVVTSCAKTCEICRSKLATYRLFEGILETPVLYNVGDDLEFPLFLKPDIGQGSKGTVKVKSKEAVRFYLESDPSLMIMEFLPGKEYTIECFTNQHGTLLYTQARERVRINNGISVNSKPVENSAFVKMAAIINKNLSLRGCWFFQVRERQNGVPVLLEIAPRIAGTSSINRVAGVNLIQLSLFDQMGLEVSIVKNDFAIEIDRALTERYAIKIKYQHVFIDFDDTIIINGMVNHHAISFLYQARNFKKRIILITKHKYNIYETLKKYKISRRLFDEIIQVEDEQEKSDFILDKESIFIDDSFQEREKIKEKLGIPVFAVESIEALLHIQ